MNKCGARGTQSAPSECTPQARSGRSKDCGKRYEKISGRVCADEFARLPRRILPKSRLQGDDQDEASAMETHSIYRPPTIMEVVGLAVEGIIVEPSITVTEQNCSPIKRRNYNL
jgi:hypothetical protein